MQTMNDTMSQIGLTFRKAVPEDDEILIQFRSRFLLELNPELSLFDQERLKGEFRDYRRRRSLDGVFQEYLALIDLIPAGCAAMLLYELPPHLRYSPRWIGHILNFYTLPEYRCQGIGFRMMEYLISEARTHHLASLFLNATPAGEPLYRKFGFHPADHTALVLDL
ncbi:MAG: GNAT family N-acetyltransferase [Candidatus Delongbacteria bacterium]|nr:GNAT family N-acetyltransferase [Candidatus Delongbacteria bacterium]